MTLAGKEQSVQMRREETRHRFVSYRQAQGICLDGRHPGEMVTQHVQRPPALVKGDARPRHQAGEGTRTGADINEGSGRQIAQALCHLRCLSGDVSDLDIDT